MKLTRKKLVETLKQINEGKTSYQDRKVAEITSKEGKSNKDYWSIELCQNQYYLGRSYIILKRDCRLLSKITLMEAKELFKIIITMESALNTLFGATMFNWTYLMNDGYKPEKPNSRVHLHLWPRYKKKVMFEGENL